MIRPTDYLLPAVIFLALVGLLCAWYVWAGLEISNPYPASYVVCGPDTKADRDAFVRECVADVPPAKGDPFKLSMAAWCTTMAEGIYCQTEAGFRYSRVYGNYAEQTEVKSCRDAYSRAERLVCGQVMR